MSTWTRDQKIAFFSAVIAIIAIIAGIYQKEIRRALGADPSPTPTSNGLPLPTTRPSEPPVPKTNNRPEDATFVETKKHHFILRKNLVWVDTKVVIKPSAARYQQIDVYGPPDAAFTVKVGELIKSSLPIPQRDPKVSHASIPIYRSEQDSPRQPSTEKVLLPEESALLIMNDSNREGGFRVDIKVTLSSKPISQKTDINK